MNSDLKYSNFCQCCLVDDELMKNMLTETYNDIKLIDSFKHCSGIDLLEVQPEQIMSCKNICATCESNLKKCIEFRELCHTSQKIVKERYNFIIKDEPVSDDEPLILYTQNKVEGKKRRGDTNFAQVFVKNSSKSVVKVEDEELARTDSPVDDKQEALEVNVNPDELNEDFQEDVDRNVEAGLLRSRLSSENQTDEMSTTPAKYMCYYCDQFLFTHKDYLIHRDNHLILLNTGLENRRIDRQCFVCKKDVVGYVKHLKKEHVSFRPHACQQCNLTFRGQNALYTHLYKHGKSKPFKCLGCSLVFKNKILLRYHITRVRHTKNLYHCIACGLGFEQFKLLDDHYHKEHNKHSHKHYFPCYKCKKVFAFNKHALKHDCIPVEQNKTKNKSTKLHNCSHCDQTFADPDELECHKISFCVSRYSCLVPGCEKVFKNQRNLSTHANLDHTNSRHICDLCGYSTKFLSKLVLHKKREHEPNYKKVLKPFNCLEPGCGKVVHSKHALETHISIFHAGPTKFFECDLCPKKFRSLISMRTHIFEHLSDTSMMIACSVCDKKFVSENARDIHMRIHRNAAENIKFKCDKCTGAFTSTSTLRMHTKRVHEGRYYECCYCQNRFSAMVVLKYHMYEHRGFKPFSCPMCSSQFVRQYLFVTHLKNHGIAFDQSIHGYVEQEDLKKLLKSCERNGMMDSKKN